MSIILRTAARFLTPLLLLFSLFLLLRGHHKPGGGFVAGLVAAAAFALCAVAYGTAAARAALRLRPQTLIGAGLLVAAASGLPGLLGGGEFMTGVWVGGAGTPIVFDLGVFLVVIGVALGSIFAFAEEHGDGEDDAET